MRALAVMAVLVGLLVFWSKRTADNYDHEDQQAQAVARNYGVYRSYALKSAFASKMAGTLSDAALGLPTGYRGMRDWKARILDEDGSLILYVHGPASPAERKAIQELFNNSKSIGWNKSGVMVRNGSALPLPSIISNGEVVSVIYID